MTFLLPESNAQKGYLFQAWQSVREIGFADSLVLSAVSDARPLGIAQEL